MLPAHSQQAIAEAAVCGGSAGLVHYCVLAATALRPSAPPTTGGPPIASGLLPAVARAFASSALAFAAIETLIATALDT